MMLSASFFLINDKSFLNFIFFFFTAIDMKIWSPLLATLVLLNSFSAQIFQDDEINIEVIDDDVE